MTAEAPELLHRRKQATSFRTEQWESFDHRGVIIPDAGTEISTYLRILSDILLQLIDE